MTRRLVATDYGAPREVLSVVDEPTPVLGERQVLVDVKAAGLNPFDVKVVQGIMGADPTRLPRVLGNECAGIVRQAAADTGFAAGDRVVVHPAVGAFAETIAVPARDVHRLPADVDFDRAAGLLLAGSTAYDLVATLNVAPTDTLLIHGGAGAVGSIAAVLAVGRGATVIATASPANHAAVRDLGAVPVAYGAGLADAIAAATRTPVTAVLDTVGADEAIDVSLDLVPPEKIVSIAAWGRVRDGITVLDGSSAASRTHRRDAVRPLLSAVATGRLNVEIAGIASLDDAADVFEELAGRHPRGKYILHL